MLLSFFPNGSLVKKQKQHHQNKTIIPALEQIKNEDDPPNKYYDKTNQ